MAGPMKGGLALLIGKPKTSSDDDDAGPPSEQGEASAEEQYAGEAFAALKDDDEAGFKAAFLGAVRACVSKAKGGGYEGDEPDEG